jgi:hypothetical protein
MLGSNILEVIIGIIFVFLLISIICTAVREGIDALLKTRSAYLERGIRELLNDRHGVGLAAAVYNHPLVFGLFSGDYKPGRAQGVPSALSSGGNLPSYIPAENFALALMDIAARGPATNEVSADPNSPAISLDSVRANIGNIQNPSVQRVLLSAIDAAQGDLNKAKVNIEAWYNSSMDRVSGWYKRSTQWIIFAIGLTAAVVFNVNTIRVADYLYQNDAARAMVVASAEKTAPGTTPPVMSYDQAKTSLDSMSLPIGWSVGWRLAPAQPSERTTGYLWNQWIAPIFGLLLTAFAASLGAPFWFDMLSKVMVLRSTLKPDEKSPESTSQNQPASAQPAAAAPTVAPQAPAIAMGGAPPGAYVSQPWIVASAPLDADSEIDGCLTDSIASTCKPATQDQGLPVAIGGIA